METVLEKKTDLKRKTLYEAIVILKPSLPDEDLLKEIDKAKVSVERWGGEIVLFENMGKKKLAYEIRKEKKGVYLLIHFNGAQNTVFEFERMCRLNEAIIKFMTIKINPNDLIPVPETKSPNTDRN